MIQEHSAETKPGPDGNQPDLYATDDGRLALTLTDAMGTQLDQIVLDDLPPGSGIYVASISGGPRDR